MATTHKQPWRVVFFGSGPLAEPTRQALLQRPEYEVVTNHGDVGVLVHYGKILSQQVIESFPCGIVNIHPSLLPAWRGPSPLQAAILHGDTITGVSVMVLDKHMDTGPLLAQDTLALSASTMAQTLYPELFRVGTQLLFKVLPSYLRGELKPVPQSTTGSSYSKMISREDGEITATDTPIMIDRKFRAFHPWPGIYYVWNNQRIKLTNVSLDDNAQLVINEVQPAGKRSMPYADFLRGHPGFKMYN